MTLHTPPHDTAAEIAVLGAMLLDPDRATPKAAAIVSAEDFYKTSHGIFFGALCAERSGNVLLVCEHLRRAGLLEQAGGQAYLAHIVQSVGTSAGVEHLCRSIRDLAVRRRLLMMSTQLAARAADLTEEVGRVVHETKAALRDGAPTERGGFLDSDAALREAFREVELRHDHPEEEIGVKTGFADLDRIIQGLVPGTYTLLIARPSQGKTSLALQIADQVAGLGRGDVLFFSLESQSILLTMRRIARYSAVHLSRLRTGRIEDSQWGYVIEASDVLAARPVVIAEHVRYKRVDMLASAVESYMLERPVALVVVDHIQKMRPQTRSQSRHRELSEVSNALCDVFKDNRVPGLVLSQLNREAVGVPPGLHHIKESGDLEQDADVVLSLYREENINPEIALIDVLKGRDVGTGRVFLRFDPPIQRWSSTSEKFTPEAEKKRKRGQEKGFEEA